MHRFFSFCGVEHFPDVRQIAATVDSREAHEGGNVVLGVPFPNVVVLPSPYVRWVPVALSHCPHPKGHSFSYFQRHEGRELCVILPAPQRIAATSEGSAMVRAWLWDKGGVQPLVNALDKIFIVVLCHRLHCQAEVAIVA